MPTVTVLLKFKDNEMKSLGSSRRLVQAAGSKLCDEHLDNTKEKVIKNIQGC